MYEDGPDMDAVDELRLYCQDQGWSALDTMMVCLCLATEAMSKLYLPEDELLEAVH